MKWFTKKTKSLTNTNWTEVNLVKRRGFGQSWTNPGSDTAGRYFKTPVADVIIIHESNKCPELERIHGNYFEGYSDYSTHSRGILIHCASNRWNELSERHWFASSQRYYFGNGPSSFTPLVSRI